MKRIVTLILLATLVSGAALPAAAQDEAAPPVRHGPRGDARGRGPAEGGSRWKESLEAAARANAAWLRENDLAPYAEQIEATLAADTPMKHVWLWRANRRVESWRRLSDDEAKRALEAARLEVAISDLARAARDAHGTPAYGEAAAKLRDAVVRQLDLRVEVGQIMARMGRERLARLEDDLRRQKELRDDLIRQRFAVLTDPEQPLPDPLEELMTEGRWHDGDSRRGDEPGASAPPPAEGDGRGPPKGPPPPGRGNERFVQAVAAAAEWLRANSHPALAERLAVLDLADDHQRLLAWQILRRVQQIQRLEEKDRQSALENERLRFEVVDLARQWREADAGTREAKARELKEALKQQFDLRLAAQQAIAEALRRRFSQVSEEFQKQGEHREAIIERRVATLLDAEKPIPEPQLVSETRRHGRPGDDRSDGPPVPDAPPPERR